MIETKELWRRLWLTSIDALTSLEFQKQSCRNNAKGDSYQSILKYFKCYFEIVLHGFNYDFYVNDIEWVTYEEHEIIKEWHNDLSNFVSNRSDRYDLSILRDKNWLNVLSDGWLAKQKLKLILPQFESDILKEIPEPNGSQLL